MIVVFMSVARLTPPRQYGAAGWGIVRRLLTAYWSKREDWVSWDFTVAKPGRFRVEILEACGSDVEFTAGEVKLKFTVQDSGHFQNFITRELGK